MALSMACFNFEISLVVFRPNITYKSCDYLYILLPTKLQPRPQGFSLKKWAIKLQFLSDLRHTLVDIGTILLCISGYNGLPGRTLPINLIHETARRSERVDNAALSSAVSYEISGQMRERSLFARR